MRSGHPGKSLGRRGLAASVASRDCAVVRDDSTAASRIAEKMRLGRPSKSLGICVLAVSAARWSGGAVRFANSDVFDGGHFLQYVGYELARFRSVAEKMWSGRPGKSLGLRGLATSAAGRKRIPWRVAEKMRSGCPSKSLDERGLAASAICRGSVAAWRPIS